MTTKNNKTPQTKKTAVTVEQEKPDFLEHDGLTTAQRLAVYQRDGGRCQLCGNSVAFSDMIAGFIDPTATVGVSDLSQRVTLHFRCHLIQKDRPLDVVRKERREKIHQILKQRLSNVPLGMEEVLKKFENEK